MGGARNLGCPLAEDLPVKMIAATESMGAYKASTVIDFERGAPLELESLFLEPWRQAARAGSATPRLKALCRVLEQCDPAKGDAGAASQP
jgi:2-dehydropantoate 2-reductase